MFFEKKCKICGFSSVSEEKIISCSGRNFYFCPNCASIFANSASYLDSASQRQRYLLHNNSLDDEGYKTYLGNFFDAALKLSIGKKELTPQDFEFFSGWDYLDYGSGPVPCLTELVKEKKIFRTVQSYDLFFTEKLPSGSKFDFITCLEVAEHFENPLQDFTKIAELLKNGGILALQTQFLEEREFEEQKKFFEKWWYKEDSTHVVFYTKKGLEECAKSCGLRLVATEKNLVVFKLELY